MHHRATFIKLLKTDISDMTGDENQFEVNQILNAKGRIGPLRDTFFLVMSGDIISSDVMGDFINSCFNPSNLQLRDIHKLSKLTKTVA